MGHACYNWPWSQVQDLCIPWCVLKWTFTCSGFRLSEVSARADGPVSHTAGVIAEEKSGKRNKGAWREELSGLSSIGFALDGPTGWISSQQVALVVTGKDPAWLLAAVAGPSEGRGVFQGCVTFMLFISVMLCIPLILRFGRGEFLKVMFGRISPPDPLIVKQHTQLFAQSYQERFFYCVVQRTLAYIRTLTPTRTIAAELAVQRLRDSCCHIDTKL